LEFSHILSIYIIVVGLDNAWIFGLIDFIGPAMRVLIASGHELPTKGDLVSFILVVEIGSVILGTSVGKNFWDKNLRGVANTGYQSFIPVWCDFHGIFDGFRLLIRSPIHSSLFRKTRNAKCQCFGPKQEWPAIIRK
jgi:hypothetical protein